MAQARGGIFALGMADDDDRTAFEAGKPAHDRLIVAECAVTRQRQEIVEQGLGEVAEMRATFQATPSARDGATVRYVVTGELVNSGPVRVVHISLGIGYLWVPHGSSLDLSAKLPENEEIVPLQEVTLDPSERRSLRLSLERDVPTSSLGEFHPVVRISDVSGE